jgi:geranylgeranyl diphosphate synthase type II
MKMGCKHRILSGDAMLILAYQYFEQYEPAVFMRLAKLFSKTRLKSVKDSNGMLILKLDDVTIPEYLK